jgi:hypothetical protein
MNILSNLSQIQKLDSKNMLGSIELLGAQIKEVGLASKASKLRKITKTLPM